MKNILTLFALFFISTFFVKAGSIEIVSIDSLVAVTPHVSEAKAKCIFKNVSSETKNIKLKVTATKISEGLEVSFCWGPICYPPIFQNEPFSPNDVITLAPGETSGPNEFYFTFIPNGYEGEAIIEALLYDRNNPSDSLLLTFHFVSYTLGVEIHSQTFELSCIIIGDLKDLEKFGYQLEKTKIYDITGSLILCPNQSQTYGFTLPRTKTYIAVQLIPRKVILFKFKI